MKLSQISLAITSLVFAHSAIASEQKIENQLSENQVSDVEVLTVHGDYRARNLQKTPASLSILSTQDISNRHAQNLEDIIGAVANVNFASGSQRARYYQIRGIGERSQFKEPINQSVGVLVDDIDLAGIASISSTFDMEQVEFFRGPQGTRFGANALAGLIYMTSNAPSDDFEGAVRASIGNYGTYGTSLMLSGPASDSVNYRFVAEKNISDGYMENQYLGVDDTNNRDELTLRGKLAITATDNLQVDLTVLYADFDNGYDAFSLDNNRTTLSDEPGFDQQKTRAVSSKFTYSGFDNMDMLTIVTHANSDLAYGFDEDWSYADIHPGSYVSKDYYFRERENTTAEIRFVSKDSAKLFGHSDWVFGLYVKNDQEALTREYTYLTSDFTSSFDADNYAVYGQLDSQLNDKWSLTSGLRFEQRKTQYHNSDNVAFSPSDSVLGGKLVLAYQIDSRSMTYASINRGFKAGSVNSDGSLSEHLRSFEPEFLWNYELGYKTSFLNDKAFVRTAVFYMDRDDIQISSYHLDERNDGSSEFISYWTNAASGKNYGVEVEFSWDVLDTVNIYGSAGLLETEYQGFSYEDGSIETGREQAHAPNYQFSFGVNYYPSEQWHVNVSVDGKDSFYFSDSHDQKSQNVALLHGAIRYVQPNWQAKLCVRNVFDKTYETRGFYFGNDPRDGYTPKAYYQLGEPAVFGVTLDYQF
ncbi:TonB-dependent receptor [Thalassotalea hakodatensis]|uniref:TonB-dependent receptor n=1 Tax=Thalassotalea hakodatensis TaxID=3030492 RepID=UPI002574713D|nr:TonB-dependent receptor [Thalassotalea hakodatensis]